MPESTAPTAPLLCEHCWSVIAPEEPRWLGLLHYAGQPEPVEQWVHALCFPAFIVARSVELGAKEGPAA